MAGITFLPMTANLDCSFDKCRNVLRRDSGHQWLGRGKDVSSAPSKILGKADCLGSDL